MQISHKLLQQRIRNRIIQSLESFAAPTWVDQLGTDEIINMWYDNMEDNETFEFFTEPVFSIKEQDIIKRFHHLLGSTHEKIPITWQREKLDDNRGWLELEKTAKEGLRVFMTRGFFSEEQEII